MKKVLLMVLCVVALSASASYGQGVDAVMLYTDQIGTSCDLVTAAGLIEIFAVHDFVAGATASQFALNDLSGMTFLSGSALHAVAVLALDPRDGSAVTYDGGCAAGPIAVMKYSYLGSGAEPACGTITVVEDPVTISGTIEGVDCAFNPTTPNGSVMTINGDGSCACGELGTPVEETSWGKVKALYN